jgi:DUF438 domain-containing protein
MIGELGKEMLDVLLETLPLEFSLVDADNKVLAWNKHETRVFKRPKAVLGKDVRDCHPRKSLHKVEPIINEMRAGTRDKAEFWIDLEIGGKKEKILIQYYALRDDGGRYLGCLEASQLLSHIQSLQGEKRLLD